jgi:diaminohydroxyphosphoribosylaminopyrimidine deaminase/5-amino-6-(5-phosphoribosylamino)uracil reductase
MLTTQHDQRFMRMALRLAQRAYGLTSPNPMVGAVLVKSGQVIGRGWHRRAGFPHAELEALKNAQDLSHSPRGATLYATMEPCSTQGRTPPCTHALIAAGIRRVVVAATDPNPRHAGRGFTLLRNAGIQVTTGVLAESASRLNQAFNHWIVHRTPWVTVKSAMTLDGKIATASGESQWITGREARAWAMKLRLSADAILVGINTVLADDPRLTIRWQDASPKMPLRTTSTIPKKILKRIVLDSRARTPLAAQVVAENRDHATLIVVGPSAPASRVKRLEQQVTVWQAPGRNQRIDLRWLLRRLGSEDVTHLLVEGGGLVNASFLLERLAQRVAFFYAPKILGGRSALKAVAGAGILSSRDLIHLHEVRWRRLGTDLVMTADVVT